MKLVIVLAVTLQVFLAQDVIAQAIPKCVSSYPQNIVETQTITQYGNSPVIQTIDTVQGPFSQYLPSQQVTTVVQNQPQLTSFIPNQPQIISNQFCKPPQIITNPTQIIDYPPQIFNSPPQIINPPQIISQPQIISNPPQIITNPPQIISNPPQIISSPPQIISNPPQIISNPPQIITNQPQIISLPQQIQQQICLPEPTILPAQTQLVSSNGLSPFPQITNVLPGTTTIIQDSSVSNNLANALQLLVVSNLLSNTLPLNGAEEIIIPSYVTEQVVQPYVNYGCGCGCNQGYVY